MRRLAILLISIVLCGAPRVSRAETTPTPKKPTLVETAKASKARRKKSTTKVITNADVKKSKGKIVVLDKPKTTEPAKKPMTIADQDERYHARLEAGAKVKTDEKKVAGLERDLEAIEQRYYEENDPNYRDTVLQKRFAQTKQQLEEARKELADARDTLKQLDTQP